MLAPRGTYNERMCRWLVPILLAASIAAAQAVDIADPATRLQFATTKLPTARLGKRYDVPIRMGGGRGPFEFTITRGKLPAGIELQRTTGTLTGAPTLTGVYHFTLSVRDETTRETAQREFVLEVTGPLLLQWVDPPKLAGNSISGSIKVTNSSTRGEPFDLTVIIVAVNEIGKAFALGYQHFDLLQDGEQTIPFSSTLPNGRYFVHVDAIAEIAATNTIYRSQLQTPPEIVVNVNR
jgi:Putative Ig domain